MIKVKGKTIARDISWLAFNARVLQEAADPAVPIKERIKFLGIFSNNLDEFFRIRVAALKRMLELGKKAGMHLEQDPQKILNQIHLIVLEQRSEFDRIWKTIFNELKKQHVFLVTEKQLNREQQKFVRTFYDEEVASSIIPLMIENIESFPSLREKGIFLAVVLSKKNSAYKKKYALIEVPTKVIPRFVRLPSNPGTHYLILLEDVIRFSIPHIFSFLEYDQYSAHIIKVTRDAEFDLDTDMSISYTQKIRKGLKTRKKGKPVRFLYDKDIDAGLLEYLIRRLNLKNKDAIIPGGRIHNFRHFMDFPESVFAQKSPGKKAIIHPAFKNVNRVTDVVLKQDIMLHFPYHSFNAVIDLLREAAMDPHVLEIKITAYRLAPNSKIINALINARRNGKKVTVMLELRARFDEEANLEWKERLEDEGVLVLLGVPNMKIHAKLCVIKRKQENKIIQYGFVSTGNLNEKTATLYGDHCLLTSNRNIMADTNRIFSYLLQPKTGAHFIKACKTLLVSPLFMRKQLTVLINHEIKSAKNGKPAGILLKLNSLSDEALINKLYEAAFAGVEVRMIIRGICCMFTQNKKFKTPVQAISIVDEYLEHARVIIFHNDGKEKVMISSADLMVRNLDHRVEAAVYIKDPAICKELKDILLIQLQDNVKARWLDNELSNAYVRTKGKKIRSQKETYHYLFQKASQLFNNIEV
ncbi:polyphosphate kinase 1 [Agriterribacter sp.]|uniref:polyphosphate kinase 1 n=1 Tax=Agriterribacter sp. TaxID=2821509 RepID=UPI002B7CD53E|nr:polyphosphate kinase 1 [Agriterribacter sp.]HTN06402.1 polyphosphate kinase 1 [Agriterribacter sp.]